MKIPKPTLLGDPRGALSELQTFDLWKVEPPKKPKRKRAPSHKRKTAKVKAVLGVVEAYRRGGSNHGEEE